MEETFRYLIAKNDADKSMWLPLWVHCADTYHVMQYLLSHWLTDGALHAVTNRCSSDQIKIVALFLSVFHDFGKSSVTFQSKITEECKELRGKLEDKGLSIPSINAPELRNSRDMPHGIAGELLLQIKGCHASLAAVVGGHHGRPWEKGPEIAQEIEEILEEDEEDIYRNFEYSLRLWGRKEKRKDWIRTQDCFYEWALNEIGLSSVKDVPIIGDSEAVVLSGLVVMADWLASNEEYFPLIPYIQDAPENVEERASLAEKRIHLPPNWRPVRNVDFRLLTKERFGFFPNEVQEKMITAVMSSTEPGLFILEAPMGIGKTEAALLAAEEFSEDRAAGMLFALPTQATANGIFSRVLEWGKKQAGQNPLSIRLAHGMAVMNEEYAALMDRGKYAECIVDDYEDNRLVVHDFFQGSKQALLADFVVGTVDQVLLASLKQKHFMLRHLGLCGKVVIIDECHAYDSYMNEYLERTLQWLGAYRTPVIMLSATLPYERRAALIDAYRQGAKDVTDETWRKSIGYPLLTWTDGKHICQEKIAYSSTEREVEIKKIKGAETLSEQVSQIIKILSDSLGDGGCAAVVVNTVKRAQDMASAVRECFPEKHVILLHSRFISEDRLEYENELLMCLGKRSDKSERDGVIVVGTQVIEQSLDFDVDLMITDLCPMDLLLQRIGRLHRHSSHDVLRPAKLKKAKCYIIGADKNLEKGSSMVYGKYLLMRTRAFLPDKIILPNDIAYLVQNVYDDTCELEEEPAGYKEAKNEHEIKRIKAKKDADAFRLPPPGIARTINRFLESSVLADEEQAKAQVRNGDATLETIVLFSTNQGLTRTPWRYNDRLSQSVCPSPSECRAISNQRIRFPAWASREIPLEELSMPEEWKNSVWLKGRYLLILDEQGKAISGNYIIQYDHSYGLVVERRN